MGTLVNVIAVVVGSLIGLSIKKVLPKAYTAIAFQALGLFTAVLGIKMAIASEAILIMAISLVLGGLTGQALQLTKRINSLSEWIKIKSQSDNVQFTEGLVSAFILWCVGAMAIIGAIEEGLGQPPNLLYTKSLLDFFSAIMLSAAMGSGVLLAAIPLAIFQFSISLLAAYFGHFLTATAIAEVSACGGVLLIALALSVLDIKTIKVVNMLPSLVYVVVLMWLKGLF